MLVTTKPMYVKITEFKPECIFVSLSAVMYITF